MKRKCAGLSRNQTPTNHLRSGKVVYQFGSDAGKICRDNADHASRGLSGLTQEEIGV